MKSRLMSSIVAALWCIVVTTELHGQGTAFTYTGHLEDNGNPANGTYNLRFAVFDSVSAGNQIGPTLMNIFAAASNGLFTVTLNFGNGIFTGASRWLEIGVRTNGSSAAFAVLTPRQALLPTPYAILAGTVPVGAIAAPMLADSSVTSAKIATGAVTTVGLANNSVGSAQLGDALDLGTTNVNGRMDVFRTTAGTVALRLDGAVNSMFLFGDDGSEVGRFVGQSYGLIELRDSDGHQLAARLTANGNSGGRLNLFNSNGVSRALLTGDNVGGALTLNQADGNTGAILSGEAGQLDLQDSDGQQAVRLSANGNSGGLLTLYDSNGVSSASLSGNGGGELNLFRLRLEGRDTAGVARLTLYEGGGNVGARLTAEDGENGPALTLSKWGGPGIIGRPGSRVGSGHLWLWNTRYLLPTVEIQASENPDGDGTGGYIRMSNGDGTVNTIEIDAERSPSGGGYIGLRNASGTQSVELDANSGVVKGQVIEITGGADFSENFDISGNAHEPGMIVSIDPVNPGQLVLSSTAYDKKVAGIISGAGGVRPGMLMGQRGSLADGKHPVALSGRVYCWVDADGNGAIEPGDMLTTSNTAGHGMKASDHSRATGAIIGKAMTSLDHGTGLVLVLVNLQ